MTRGLKKKEIRKTTKKLVSLTSFTRQDERADERNVFCESPLAPLPCVRRMKKKSVRPAWLLAAIKRRRKTYFHFISFFLCVTSCGLWHTAASFLTPAIISLFVSLFILYFLLHPLICLLGAGSRFSLRSQMSAHFVSTLAHVFFGGLLIQFQ